MLQDYFTPEQIPDVVGRSFVSDWLTVDQERITTFGHVTDDLDLTHIDPHLLGIESQ